MSDNLMRRVGRAADVGDRGASAVEYGLLVAAIAGMIVLVVFVLGGIVKSTLYDDTCARIKGQGSAAVDC